MPVAFGFMAVHSYVAAEAYVQASHNASLATSVSQDAANANHSSYSNAPSVFFASSHHRATQDWSTYRSSLLVRFPQSILPQDIVDYLLNQSLLTGHHYSLFRHGPASAPRHYEVREGSPTECDRSVLGGTDYDLLEELFFETAWVAHVHPPAQSPLPTGDDLAALAQRATLRPGLITRHSLFGFRHGEPVCVEIQGVYDPLFGEVSMRIISSYREEGPAIR
jgi:hypothetical protein